MNRPIALVCYICGRQFGTKSLGIHIKACQKKWQNQQNLKPRKQRRPCPQAPKGLAELLEKDTITRKDILAMNSGTFGTYMEEALVQCEYCGRKFNEKSLIPHQKACKISPMLKKPPKSQGQGNQNPQQPSEQSNQPDIKVPSKGYNLDGLNASQPSDQDLTQCNKCGRKFAADRILKHQKVCKGSTVKKTEKETPVQKPIEKPKPEKDPKWKTQHQQFQKTLKYMKQMKKIEAQGGKASDLPPPPRSNYDHYTECPYCGRKFAQDVADRHIPKCKNVVNKPGGIKPSQIQQKYIGGTGVNRQKLAPIANPPLIHEKPQSPAVEAMQKGRTLNMTSNKQLPKVIGSSYQNDRLQNPQFGRKFIR